MGIRIFNKKRYLFIIFGSINVLLTNIIIQILLVFIKPIFSTLIGQIFNFVFGFYFYGKNVFKVGSLKKSHFKKYIFLNISIWNINWIIISYLNTFGFSKNIIALFLIPPLALISYFSQKYFVFKKKYK